jgi:hypothetical protein
VEQSASHHTTQPQAPQSVGERLLCGDEISDAAIFECAHIMLSGVKRRTSAVTEEVLYIGYSL